MNDMPINVTKCEATSSFLLHRFKHPRHSRVGTLPDSKSHTKSVVKFAELMKRVLQLFDALLLT